MTPDAIGLYDPEFEHDSCGVGLIAAIDGQPRRDIVEKGLKALKSVWHRGAVDADGKTGDGAGLHIQIPHSFFVKYIERNGHTLTDGTLAVGMIFLPRADLNAQETCRTIIETEVIALGFKIYGWRQVPIDISVLGEKANSNRPDIQQIMLGDLRNRSPESVERDLYIARRRIETSVDKYNINGFYICSLSHRSLIYKGMMLAEHVDAFYPDLQSADFISAFAIYHQRYSTNTFPQWWLAQPFRVLAHNGEINTLRGNVNWMKSHEIRMASDAFGDHSKDIKPIVRKGSSDSAALDAVFEVMIHAGRSVPMVKTMLVPEAWSKITTKMPDAWQAMYAYANSVMQPWDGPAALACTDGRWVMAGLDRNGLRPMRYMLTKDGLLIAGSESGMVEVETSHIIERGALGPGEMIAVDLQERTLFHDAEIKDKLSKAHPFSEWTKNIVELDQPFEADAQVYTGHDLHQRQRMAGMSLEELEIIVHPMAKTGKEAVGSMGDDTPIAVLSRQHRPLSHFFRQNFSQVTNPPIDPIREHQVMSLKTRFSNLKNVLDADPHQMDIFSLETPNVSNGQFLFMKQAFGESAKEISLSFSRQSDMETALNTICEQAENAVRTGEANLILTDEYVDADHLSIPSILAVSSIHNRLIDKQLRSYCSINIRTSDCYDAHGVAVLIGCGATTVNPYLVQDCIAERHVKGLFGDLSLNKAIENYHNAISQGLLKIISKLGISVISSYRGGYNFEALGLSRALVARYFPGMPSRISGIGLGELERKIRALHQQAFHSPHGILPVGGFYKQRAEGESHAWRADPIHILQESCTRNDYNLFRSYVKAQHSTHAIHLRDLLDFNTKNTTPLDLGRVESITSIRKRFVTPGMSLGSLSPEAHRTLAIAMNRIGAKSDSGEGGEDPDAIHLTPNGDNLSAKIKQVASGRFGVTAQYLNACEELEIKIAQGAKPGEGGQLPGFKVTEMIAKLRHSTPGITLISPPPHHDIYSIEDLSQLIYDLKQVNPRAKVCVKLVAASGVGTIAAGVAKAKADIILISGHNGGTGASPQTSIKHAGMPWEMGLAEVHQVLCLNNLRERVTLRTDGGLKTGRDIVMAAMLGAEEFGIGTAALVAMGCIMVRQCQSNTCPVGVCTQDEDLRARFSGTPEKVINLFSFIAQDVREILASVGLSTLESAVGRTDLITQLSRGNPELDDLDLNPLLVQIDEGRALTYNRERERVPVTPTLDEKIIADAQPFFNNQEKMSLSYTVQNTDRTIGARVSSHIVTGQFRDIPEAQLHIQLSGSAGQSLGAFCVKGLKIELFGDANDYVGKGLSGATLVIRTPHNAQFAAHNNVIIGNTCLYGATSGLLFANGRAGERLAVRNSGAQFVVEGAGSNACEYMTGGIGVILGRVGQNFGAGMTGGTAFVYDPDDVLEGFVNFETVRIRSLTGEDQEGTVYKLIEQHILETDSAHAKKILQNWRFEKQSFKNIYPI